MDGVTLGERGIEEKWILNIIAQSIQGGDS